MINRRHTLLAIASDPGGVDNDFYNPNPNYLTIVALEDGLTVQLPKSSENVVEYSIDGNDNWTTLTAGTISPAINTGQYISFRGNIAPNSSKHTGKFTISKSCDLTGNCNSLLFGDDAVNNLDLTGYYGCYRSLFDSCYIVKVSPTFLPATTLGDYCYTYMFSRCTSLISAPALPATTLAKGCYGEMFTSCTSLTTAPELSATTLVNNCYFGMFKECTSLTIAPELPATTLVNNCYGLMFEGCSKLNYIKAMFMSPPSSSYTSNWVSGVSSIGIFVKNIDATWSVTGSSGIPSGWTMELEEPGFDDYTSKPKYYLNMGENDTVGQNAYNFIMDKYINGGNEYKYDELIFVNGYQIPNFFKYYNTSIQLYCTDITYNSLILYSDGVVGIEHGGGSND